MSIDDAIQAIESVEFDATLGLISGFERFVRVALQQPQSNALMQALRESRRARVRVEERAEQLIQECRNLTEHIHARDIALSVYVLALHEVGSARVKTLARELASNRISWWSRQVGQRILSSLEQSAAQGLRFRFDWSDASDEPAQGRLQVWVGAELVWHDGTNDEPRGAFADWSEFLDKLSAVWVRLVWEDGFPAPIDARDPSEFDVKTRDYLDAIPAPMVAEKRALFDEFRAHHDLSKVASLEVQPLWVVGQGHEAWVCTGRGEVCVRRPRREVVATLRALGDEIAARLEHTVGPDLPAVEAWERAEQVDVDSTIAISTGLQREDVQQLGGGRVFEFSAERPGQTELMAAARMLVTADYRSVLLRVLEIVSEVPPSPSTVHLDAVSLAARQELAKLSTQSKPHEQGYVVAGWLRGRQQSGTGPISPRKLLDEWGVDIIRVELSEPEVEAIAVWGPRHGPAILLNTRAKYWSPNRENITLAHEIAHLLLDREDALPLAEVLGGNVPKLVEQRARAFAAELLLPRAIASSEFAAASEPAEVLEALVRRFEVSREVIAWQARNSEQVLPRAVESFLRTQVSKPQSY